MARLRGVLTGIVFAAIAVGFAYAMPGVMRASAPRPPKERNVEESPTPGAGFASDDDSEEPIKVVGPHKRSPNSSHLDRKRHRRRKVVKEREVHRTVDVADADRGPTTGDPTEGDDAEGDHAESDHEDRSGKDHQKARDEDHGDGNGDSTHDEHNDAHGSDHDDGHESDHDDGHESDHD
jgi:hypothetical protein